MGKAIITITMDHLKELLDLPDNVEIYGVISENQMLIVDSKDILIKLRGDNLPKCREGQIIETITMDKLKGE